MSGMRRTERRRLRHARDNHVRLVMAVLIILVMLVAKGLVAFILPPKYFYDNNRILGMTNATLGIGDQSGMKEWEGSYRVASDLFASLNIPRFETMLDWSIALGFLLTLVMVFMTLRADAPDLMQSVFILATVGLLNIYVFTIGKDVIQFFFFFAVYAILLLPLRSSTLKVVLSAAVLWYESTFFREYYVLIAALVLLVYAILTFFRTTVQRFTAGTVVQICVTLFVTIWLVLAVSSVAMPDEYNQVMTLRDSYSTTMDGNADSSTFIQNWVPGGGLPVFMANYVIDAFRMMIPLELALRGPYYWPFFIFQVLVTVYLVNLLRQMNKLNDPTVFLALCVFIGYALASFLFEPDFGSWTRHEAATFPVLHLLVLNRYQRIPLTEQERQMERELA
ncbi:hypothetical protein H7U32_04845 [Bifidobacterium pullorum subsp. saeculare]|uniref:Uncharacterized protein n=1 Tax=Bifidobacterium pullorum subsp. saeculare TaxID=78257 RepID=A0A939BA97_9BIFI|nr:hypothetical protein [Bifidobacterium pullorum]MBM6699651.1 hypothetical protein [Bifidobacterium pullorum subsp. saeculare]